MTALENQLRSELRAESELIGPGTIPPLQLGNPEPGASRAPGRTAQQRLHPRRWPTWVTALAAAAAVLAVIAGALTVARVISASGPHEPVTPVKPSLYSGVPKYYAYAVQGSIYSSPKTGESVIARYVNVRETATGRLITKISPPARYDAFEGFTGDAADRTFVFAAQRHNDPKLDGTPRIYQLDQRTPLKFTILRISPSGRPQLSPLSLPVTLTEGQSPTFALSPDGTQLAVAYGGSGQPAVVQVITLATGQVHRWVSPKPAATPVLSGIGAWTADGRTLALGQMIIDHSGVIKTAPTRMLLLNTASPGTDLATASSPVTTGGVGTFPWPFMTPDGASLVGVSQARHTPNQITASGALRVYSARSGALLRVQARWQRHLKRYVPPGRQFRQAVIWSDFAGGRLIVETPHGSVNEVGFLAGNVFTPLPQAAQAPLRFAVNAGGYQTSGGYVGFAW